MTVATPEVVHATFDDDDTEEGYRRLVEAGRNLVNETGWILGDLADKVEIHYGEGRMSEYARDIGVAYKTLLNARTVARAFPEGSRRRELSFGAAAVLASQSDRHAIVGRKPDVTVADARAIVRERKQARDSEARYINSGPGTDPQPNEDDEPVDYGAALRELSREISRTTRDLPVEYAGAFADILDKAANKARRRLKQQEKSQDAVT